MKDWTGNKKATFTTLGASSHSDHDREENDYYATSPTTIKPLLDMCLKHNIKMATRIWENASGENHLSNELKKIGVPYILNTDIVQRTQDTIQLDFLNDTFPVREYLNALDGEFVNILTNPPYKYATEWVYKSMEFLRKGEYLFLFLKIQFLEGQKRRKLFKKYPPKYVFVFSKRQKCVINGDFKNAGSSAMCYCWFVWEKGFNGFPTIDWL